MQDNIPDLTSEYQAQAIAFSGPPAIELTLFDAPSVYRNVADGVDIILDMKHRTIIGFRLTGTARARANDAVLVANGMGPNP